MTYDSPFAAIGDIRDTGAVEAQVGNIVCAFAPRHDLAHISNAFGLLDRALDGELPGYLALKTLYHNRSHTNEVVLCAARLLHGMHLAGLGFDDDHIDATLIGALMHDIGYLMKDDEASGTGAQFTDTHVLRGVEFVRTHLGELPQTVLDATTNAILLTDHRKDSGEIRFDDPQQKCAAQATATADLIGQMANREYLERLLLLFFEFEEAGIGDFADIHDLLERTNVFYQASRVRLDEELNDLGRHLALHFKEYQGVERNFYKEAIDRNLEYLERVVQVDRVCRLDFLKRGGVVEQVLELKGGL
jgi:predicted HD phosphohydrolase